MARITNALRHTHKYFRMESTGLWYCAGIDGCTHYMPKNMPSPAGRMSLCWTCGKPFQLAPYNMRNDYPNCDKCDENKEVFDSIVDELDEALKEKNPYTGFDKANPLEQLRRRARMHEKGEKEKDQIEVIEPNETDEPAHDDDCEIWKGLKCTCRA